MKKLDIPYDKILQKVKSNLKMKPRFSKQDINKIELELYKQKVETNGMKEIVLIPRQNEVVSRSITPVIDE